MGRIVIKSLKYEGDKYYYHNDKFREGVNLVLGENGNGKSTFTYLIVYCFGINVPYFLDKNKEKDEDPITEIIEDTNNYIEINVLINEKEYVLNRKIKTNFINVYDKSNNLYKIYNISRNGLLYEKEREIFSDWILEQLGINLVEIEQFNTNHKVNFDDLMRLMYYDQRTSNFKIISEFGFNSNNYYKNSTMMKRSIFEILISRFYGEYYNMFYKVKDEGTKKQKLIIEQKAIENIIENINLKLDINQKKDYVNNINKKRSELKKLGDIREKIVNSASDELEDNKLYRLRIIQRELLKNISIRNDLYIKLEEFQEDLNKSIYVKEMIVDDIRRLEKILFTSKFYSILDEERCPFCLEHIENSKSRCICGSDKPLDYSKFIYSDKEYENIIKSKVKGLKTTNESIKFCETEIVDIENELEKIELAIDDGEEYINKISKSMVNKENYEVIDEITDKIIKLREEILELEIVEKNNKELEKLNNLIEKKNNNIEKFKIKLEELDNIRMDRLSENISIFEESYEGYLRDFYGKDIIKNVSINRNYMPVIGEYKEQSFNVPKRVFYYLSLLDLSISNEINYPKFLIIDTVKAEGLDIIRVKQLNSYFKEYIDKECQIILTSGYEEYVSSLDGCIIEKLSNNDKLLRRKE